MRIVVVGATGNLGSCLVAALSREDRVDSVIGLARRPPERQPDGAGVVGADMTRDDLTAHCRGADAVVHLAWLFQPTHRPIVTWRNNVLGSLRVFRAVLDAKVPAFVYASSVGAYAPGPADDHPVTEGWPTHGWPLAAYTREKAYLERALDALEARHPQLRVVRMRPAFLFRRRSAAQQRRLFAGPLLPSPLLRPALIPMVPLVFGLRFQALHVDDAADAFVRATLGTHRGAFNLATGPTLGSTDLAALYRSATFPLPASVARVGLAAAWHAHLVPASPQLFDAVLRLPLLDAGRARRELDWSPRYDGREALQQMLIGLREGRTPPLRSGGRVHELGTGIGEKRPGHGVERRLPAASMHRRQPPFRRTCRTAARRVGHRDGAVPVTTPWPTAWCLSHCKRAKRRVARYLPGAAGQAATRIRTGRGRRRGWLTTISLASPSSQARMAASVLDSSRETCIWETPSRSAICCWVSSSKNRQRISCRSRTGSRSSAGPSETRSGTCSTLPSGAPTRSPTSQPSWSQPAGALSDATLYATSACNPAVTSSEPIWSSSAISATCGVCPSRCSARSVPARTSLRSSCSRRGTRTSQHWSRK